MPIIHAEKSNWSRGSVLAADQLAKRGDITY